MQPNQQPFVFDGQGNLLLPGIHSPDYVPGVSGWSINRDGTAEFVEALIAAILQTGATGNRVKIYETTRNGVKVGVIELWTDRADVTPGSIQVYGTADGTMPKLTITPPANPGAIDIPVINLTYDPDTGTSRAEIPVTNLFLGWSPTTNTHMGNAVLSGSLQVGTSAELAGEVWQTPVYGANWLASTTFNTTTNWAPLQYRRDAEDNLWLIGCFKAGATVPVNPVFTLPTGYLPKTQWPLMISRNNAGTVTNFYGEIRQTGNLNLFTQLGGGIAANNEYLINAKIPLGNIT